MSIPAAFAPYTIQLMLPPVWQLVHPIPVYSCIVKPDTIMAPPRVQSLRSAAPVVAQGADGLL